MVIDGNAGEILEAQRRAVARCQNEKGSSYD